MAPPLPESSTAKIDGGMDNGRPPTDIPVKPTYKYVLTLGFRSNGAVTEPAGGAELNSRVDDLSESRSTRQ
ncbi:hypothetical protein HanIR_Chr06g0295521 [Helianthus annuus]|nr:hypothetical protein HanIR_Chr06g0295521 [Helianthus annuus]